MNIFVGNLAFDATQDDIKKLFEGFGNVTSAVIVMSREKKAPKSRGFGFVEMSDEEQALAAIAALNEKEFMGRILNISQARPKTEADRQSELKMKMQLRAKAKAELLLRKEQEQQKVLANPILNQHLVLKDGRVRLSGRPGTYRGGRRTRSYVIRRGLAGMQEEAKPRQRNQDNPMRWRKRKDQAKPWQKAEGEARPWKKAEGEFKPWRKSEGGIKPWKKPAGDAKPWSKSSERPQKSRFKGRRKPGGYKR
jgi:RNA recognition motif-containing protein